MSGKNFSTTIDGLETIKAIVFLKTEQVHVGTMCTKIVHRQNVYSMYYSLFFIVCSY